MSRIRAHISRRSAYLILYGAAWITYGLALHDAPQAGSLAIYGTVPMTWQGWAWVTCGAVCVASVVVPKVPRWIGFPAAVLMPLLWSAGFLVEVVGGRPFAWQGAVIWGLFAALAAISAGDEQAPR